MSQIAQQDNLYIEIATAAASMDATTKAKLIQCIKDKTITDVVLTSVENANAKNTCKVLGYEVDNTTPASPAYSICILDANNGTIESVLLS